MKLLPSPLIPGFGKAAQDKAAPQQAAKPGRAWAARGHRSRRPKLYLCWRDYLHRYRAVLGLILLFGAAGLVLLPDHHRADPAVAQPDQRIVVATKDLAAGTVLSAADLQLRQLPLRPATAEDSAGKPLLVGALQDLRQAEGQRLAAPVVAGSPILAHHLLSEAFFAQLPPGHRLLPVRIQRRDVAEFLLPGAEVQLLRHRGPGREELPPTQLCARARVLYNPLAALPPTQQKSGQSAATGNDGKSESDTGRPGLIPREVWPAASRAGAGSAGGFDAQALVLAVPQSCAPRSAAAAAAGEILFTLMR